MIKNLRKIIVVYFIAMALVALAASVVKDSYLTYNDFAQRAAPELWFAQSFTTTSAYNATSVKLRLRTGAGTTGTFTASLRATSGGNPTGSDLASASIDASTVTADTTNGELYEFVFASPVALADATKYAIVLRGSAIDASHQLGWFNHYPTGSYSGGGMNTSSNSGSTWSGEGTNDAVFEIWGNTDPVGGGGSISNDEDFMTWFMSLF